MAVLLGIAGAEAKTPGKTYCFHGVCHYVKTIEETQREVGKTSILSTSYYDDPKVDRFNPSNLTSSGEYFRAWAPDNAASPNYPNGTKLLVWNPANQSTLIVRVNNAGPYWGDRRLDLSRAGAEKLGMTRAGVAKLHVRVLSAPTPAEARYQKGRTYEQVPGHVGLFASLDAAFQSVGKAFEQIFTGPATTAVASAGEPAPRSGRQTDKSQPPAKPAASTTVASLPLDNPLTAVGKALEAFFGVPPAQAAAPDQKSAQATKVARQPTKTVSTTRVATSQALRQKASSHTDEARAPAPRQYQHARGTRSSPEGRMSLGMSSRARAELAEPHLASLVDFQGVSRH